MRPLDTFSNDSVTATRSLIAKTVFHEMAVIDTVTSEDDVIVKSMMKVRGAISKYRCRYLTISSSAFSIRIPPKKGDIVAVLSLRHSDDGMFEGDPKETPVQNGYTKLSMVCVPLNFFASAALMKIDVDLDGSEASISVDGVLNIDADELHFNGDSKNLVTHAELDSALQSFKGSIDIAIAGAITGHSHATAAPGTPSPGVGSAPATSLDISGAKASTLKTGG